MTLPMPPSSSYPMPAWLPICQILVYAVLLLMLALCAPLVGEKEEGVQTNEAHD